MLPRANSACRITQIRVTSLPARKATADRVPVCKRPKKRINPSHNASDALYNKFQNCDADKIRTLLDRECRTLAQTGSHGIAVALLANGRSAYARAEFESLPEFSPVVVEVQTESLGLSAEEVEQLITVPLEADRLNGVAWVQDTIRARRGPVVDCHDLRTRHRSVPCPADGPGAPDPGPMRSPTCPGHR